MMGAGGFIRNPGWEILSGDDLMDDEYDDEIIVQNFFLNDGDDVELNSEVILFHPPEELDENEDYEVVSTDDEEEENEENDDLERLSLEADDDWSDDDSALELSN